MSDDLIRRRAVLALFVKNNESPFSKTWQQVNELPSVKPEPKTGHWIKIDDCSNSGYYCSECRKRVVKEGWSDTVKIIKYCPNCGAKMQEVE